jgi:hypothetical protein
MLQCQQIEAADCVQLPEANNASDSIDLYDQAIYELKKPPEGGSV